LVLFSLPSEKLSGGCPPSGDRIAVTARGGAPRHTGAAARLAVGSADKAAQVAGMAAVHVHLRRP